MIVSDPKFNIKIVKTLEGKTLRELEDLLSESPFENVPIISPLVSLISGYEGHKSQQINELKQIIAGGQPEVVDPGRETERVARFFQSNKRSKIKIGSDDISRYRDSLPLDRDNLSQEDLKRPSVNATENSPARYKRKYNTIAHRALDIEQPLGHSTDANYKLLDEIIDAVKNKVTINKNNTYTKEEAVKILQTIASTLVSKGLRYKVNTLLGEGLKTRQIDCDNYAMIYLAVAEVLNLPLVAVLAPKHAFIRWDPDGKHDAINKDSSKNMGDFNWETTANEENKVRSDEHYIDWLKTSKSAIQNGAYLRSLTAAETIGIIYDSSGIAHLKREDLKLAIKHYKKAIEIDPNNAYSHMNLGVAQVGLGKFREAFASYRETISLNSNNAAAHYNLGNLYFKRGKYEKAIEHYKIAIDKDPNNAYSYVNLGVAQVGLGKLRAAFENFQKATVLKPNYTDAHRCIAFILTKF